MMHTSPKITFENRPAPAIPFKISLEILFNCWSYCFSALNRQDNCFRLHNAKNAKPTFEVATPIEGFYDRYSLTVYSCGETTACIPENISNSAFTEITIVFGHLKDKPEVRFFLKQESVWEISASDILETIPTNYFINFRQIQLYYLFDAS